MASNSSSFPTFPAPEKPGTPPPLPSPQMFDTLPPLHALLLRLLPSPSAPLIDPSALPTALPSSEPSQNTTHIDLQHLAPLASSLKVRISKARAAVLALPDVERSVAEQEEEILELEQRVRMLRGVLEGLAKTGGEKEG